MRKIVLSISFTVIFFLLEFTIFNLVGKVFVPNFLLLLFVFITLALGIRFGLLSAVLSGFLKDCFSGHIFGTNLFTFVVCVFAIVIFKRQFYDSNSRASKLMFVFLAIIVEQTAKSAIYFMYGYVDLFQVVYFIFIPEVIMTLLFANVTFDYLKKCALKLFVL